MNKLLIVSGLWLICLMLFGMADVYCQGNVILYEYDLNGNRVLRKPLYITELSDSTDIADSSQAVTDAFHYSEEKNHSSMNVTTIDNCQVSVFPNPIDESFNVIIEGLSNYKYAKLELHSMNGNQVFVKQELEATNTISVPNLVAGTYILSVFIENSRAQWKLVKF